MKNSLVQRILVQSEEEADEIIDELDEKYSEYERCRTEEKELNEEYTKLISKTDLTHSLTKLERFEHKAAIREAKEAHLTAKDDLLATTDSLPNILSDMKVVGSPMHYSVTPKLKIFKKELHPPPDRSKLGVLDKFTQLHTGLTYLIGEKAQDELTLTHHTAEYLEYMQYHPITVPSFIRQELELQTGIVQDDNYTLQTKREMHEEVKDSIVREANPGRKEKAEDLMVFQPQGLTETTLTSYFLRKKLPIKILPLRLFSIGNRYRKPFTGRPVQSKVAMFITASSSAQAAHEEYLKSHSVIEGYWQSLMIPIITIDVEPHNLQLHEAAATEYVMNIHHRSARYGESRATVSHKQHDVFPVLSRLSLSYDYVSRRMTTYADFGNNSEAFCHFTTAELIDITELIDVTESK